MTVDLSGDGQTLEPIVASEATDHVADRPVVLELRDLHVTFPTEFGDVQAVRGVDLDGARGRDARHRRRVRVGQVGDVPRRDGPAAEVGAHRGLGRRSAATELVGRRSASCVNRARGKRIAMIFQDPLSALNPAHRIGDQIVEMIRSHQDMSKEQAAERAVELLDIVGIPQPADAGAAVPARVLRRHAPARDDRHGDRQRPRGADRRRADDGARRDGAGADPRGAAAHPEGDAARRSCSSPTTSASSPASPTGCR